MKSHVTRLIKYMKTKNHIVMKHTGGDLPLFEKEDYLEARSWGESFAEKICMVITTQLNSIIEDEDEDDRQVVKILWGNLCPWCVRFESCIGCGYGARHGNCAVDPSSRFATLRRGLFSNQRSNPISLKDFKDLLETLSLP